MQQKDYRYNREYRGVPVSNVIASQMLALKPIGYQVEVFNTDVLKIGFKLFKDGCDWKKFEVNGDAEHLYADINLTFEVAQAMQKHPEFISYSEYFSTIFNIGMQWWKENRSGKL